MTSREFLNEVLSAGGKCSPELQKRIEMHIAGILEDLPTCDVDNQEFHFEAGGAHFTLRTERGSWTSAYPEYHHATICVGPIGCEYAIIGVPPGELRRLGEFFVEISERYSGPIPGER